MRFLETIDRLVRWDALPLPGRADVATLPAPQSSPDPQPAQEATLAEEDRLWRAVTTSGQRELPWTRTQEQMLDATEAYRANPLAFRIVELTADHVLGKGLRLKCSDRAVQHWLDAWWTHPQNHMAPRCYELCRELSISGEVFVTYHRNPLDGMVYVRQIPPVNVDSVETDPEDLEREVRYHESGATAEVMGRWWGADECSHYTINRLAGCTRGQGDLASVLPWLRRYKDWLTDRVRINKFKGAFLWWVKLSGADRTTVERKRAELSTPPDPGSVIVTNESEEWTAVQPRIDAQAVEPDGRAMRLMLAAGAGIPLHFFGEPEHANRATAAEMQSPTLRHFENRQVFFGWMIADIARRALEIAGAFPGRDFAITAVFEDLTVADNQRTAQAAAAMVGALAVAKDRGWIDDAAARNVLTTYIGIKQEAQTL
ncbi:MAG: hypothetical protein M0Z94_11445 [Dehalococcoidales bacterium]|nr:hypothetical protein [Dehalococcoidales bacterium]